jgi:hypothetical protein
MHYEDVRRTTRPVIALRPQNDCGFAGTCASFLLLQTAMSAKILPLAGFSKRHFVKFLAIQPNSRPAGRNDFLGTELEVVGRCDSLGRPNQSLSAPSKQRMK